MENQHLNIQKMNSEIRTVLSDDDISVTTVLARYLKTDGTHKVSQEELFRSRNECDKTMNDHTAATFVVLSTYPAKKPLDEFAFRSRNGTLSTARSVNTEPTNYYEDPHEDEVFELDAGSNELTFRSHSFQEETTEEEATLVDEDIIEEENETALEDEFLNSSMYNEVHESMLVHHESTVIYEEAEEEEEIEEVEEIREVQEELATYESRDVDDYMVSDNAHDESRDVDDSYINQVTSEEFDERTANSVDCVVADDSSSKENVPYNQTEEKNAGGAFGGISLAEYIEMKSERDYSDEMSVISFGVSKLNNKESNLYKRILEIQGRRKVNQCDVINE